MSHLPSDIGRNDPGNLTLGLEIDQSEAENMRKILATYRNTYQHDLPLQMPSDQRGFGVKSQSLNIGNFEIKRSSLTAKNPQGKENLRQIKKESRSRSKGTRSRNSKAKLRPVGSNQTADVQQSGFMKRKKSNSTVQQIQRRKNSQVDQIQPDSPSMQE